MHTLPREQSGFDDSIPLLGVFTHAEDRPGVLDKATDFIKRRFPRADIGKLDPIGFGKRAGNENKIVSFGPKGGESGIFKTSFTDKFKGALGPRAEDIISEEDTAVREEGQRLREAEKTTEGVGNDCCRKTKNNK